jgi:hypothetical protein
MQEVELLSLYLSLSHTHNFPGKAANLLRYKRGKSPRHSILVVKVTSFVLEFALLNLLLLRFAQSSESARNRQREERRESREIGRETESDRINGNHFFICILPLC